MAFVVREPEAQVLTVTPSKTSEATGVRTEYPVPDTSTAAPTGPWLGKTIIETAVSANATSFERVLVAVSLPTTSYGPTDPSEGAAKLQLKFPFASVVMTVVE